MEQNSWKFETLSESDENLGPVIVFNEALGLDKNETKMQSDYTSYSKSQSNFKNLNSIYESIRIRKAKNTSESWLKKIGGSFREKIEEEKVKIFKA